MYLCTATTITHLVSASNRTRYKNKQTNRTNHNHPNKPTTNLKLTLRRNTPYRTTHIRALRLSLFSSSSSSSLRTKQNQLAPAHRTPPRNAVMRPLDIHLPAAQGLPEALDAGGAHLRVRDDVDERGGERQPFLEVVDAKEAEAVDEGQGEGRLFGEGRGWAFRVQRGGGGGGLGEDFVGGVEGAVVQDFEQDGGEEGLFVGDGGGGRGDLEDGLEGEAELADGEVVGEDLWVC